MALCEQAQEEIYDLFSWTEARFEFSEGPPPPKPKDFPLADTIVDASPTSVMLEAARRQDELSVIRKVIPNDSMIPIRTTKVFAPEKLSLDSDLLISIYRHVNGRVGISEVIRLSLYPRFEALRGLYMMAKKGYIRVVDREGATVMHLQAASAKAKESSTGSGVRPTYSVPEGERRSILLLGDMPKYRSTLAALLRGGGYQVLEETSNQAATLLMENRKVDCVILDVGLATADDFQFVSWLCENTPSPVIILSADASKEAAMSAVQKGARAYVVKPFTRDSMMRTLAGVFQQYSSTGLKAVKRSSKVRR